MKISVITLLLCLTAGSALAQDQEKTWTGKWNNRKYNTTGQLKCVASVDAQGKWTAEFTGEFHGDPFKYNVTFNSKPGRNQTDLAGEANIRGHEYQWTGAMKGNVLMGSYRSSVGYFGEFRLEEVPSKK